MRRAIKGARKVLSFRQLKCVIAAFKHTWYGACEKNNPWYCWHRCGISWHSQNGTLICAWQNIEIYIIISSSVSMMTMVMVLFCSGCIVLVLMLSTSLSLHNARTNRWIEKKCMLSKQNACAHYCYGRTEKYVHDYDALRHWRAPDTLTEKPITEHMWVGHLTPFQCPFFLLSTTGIENSEKCHNKMKRWRECKKSERASEIPRRMQF